MKISAQEKIAELERRILALEEQVRKMQQYTITTKLVSEEFVGSKWAGLWAKWEELFKRVGF